MTLAKRFALHKADWNSCTRCELHEHRTKVCLVRGSLPADILFVAEAPGKSENGLGQPLVGPAGHLMDRIVEAALAPFSPTPRVAFTNLVGCIPILDERGKEGQPEPEHIDACRPRLQELIDMANPRLIVRVGAMASGWVTPGFKGSVKVKDGVVIIDVEHPAHIARMPIAQAGLAESRAVVTIRNAVEDLK
jgi:uracil-DNA glycosylase